MKSFSNKIFDFLLVLIVSLITFSCSPEWEDPVLPADPAGIQAGGDADPGLDPNCIESEFREFDLTPINPLDFEIQADVAFSLRTDGFPYTVDSCLCRINRYDILFKPDPNFPSSDSITVSGRNGEEIAFQIVADHAPFQTIRITAPEKLDGPTFDVYIDFEVEDYNYELAGAGGLCIIDNLDATEKQLYAGLLYYSPLLHTIPSLNPLGEPTKEVYIPTLMTQASN